MFLKKKKNLFQFTRENICYAKIILYVRLYKQQHIYKFMSNLLIIEKAISH